MDMGVVKMSGLVHQLVHQARRTFSREKTLPEEMEKLKKIMSQITPKDFNLDSTAIDKPWDYPPFVTDAPAAFMNVYECPDFNVAIFMLKANKEMPLHDHPQMHGLMKILSGSMCVTSYNRPEKKGSNSYIAKFFRTILATPSTEPCYFTPEEGNIHQITAQDSHVAFLDILAPPYAPEEGRDCTYYFKDTKQSNQDENLIWLTSGQNPSWFSCIPQPYNGPKVD